ncbi:RdgB/HAM1 family non-canonical purine NTP pyrophosphatase [Thiomicrospira sp. WB1]|uniref:RdgB/HAM1 family non-canonical purine NTP pyrophosphatase n=1 Tax=Thiomicrospira sp. WB1 TaxID=1685380 RepID=UPI000748E9CC|nr:RdgB/HAM1 family non-canonical purine NTP pyrophosphatase [Thiomicrospira sp. WB1]KUJ72542.1 non-canonical purine NTP pyrophosphatase [Thiomicrospira sp. WB1]
MAEHRKEQWVLATGNPGKLAEMQSLLAPLGIDLRPQSDFFTEAAEENGLSFVENALIKARFASEKTGLPAMADDSGLEVAALDGEPGIFSARYGEGFQGQAASDAVNNAKLVDALQGVPAENRQACYYCAMVWVRHARDPVPRIGLGQWCGQVLEAPQGEGGFGYDPLIWLPEQQCTAAALPKADKNRLSHRAQAIHALMLQF